MKCAARFAKRIAAWVSETPPAGKNGASGPVQITMPKSSADGCNGAQITVAPSCQRNTGIQTTRDWIYARAPKATDKALIPAYHETHARLRAEMIRKGG